MAYAFDKVRLLGYNHTPIFFENGTRYKVKKNLKIQGIFYAPGTDSGVGATWTKAEMLLAGAVDYQEVFLNNVYFGIGKITNISFDEGDHVVKQNYTFDLECYDEVDATANFLTGGVNGYIPDILPVVAALIDKIEENVTYEIDNDGNQTYTQTATVRFNQHANGVDANDNVQPNLEISTAGPGVSALQGAINSAEALITSLFQGSVVLLDSVGSLTANFERLNTIGSTLLTKSYNLVDGQLAFTRKVTIPVGDAGAYSVSYSYEIRADANNVSTVTEKAAIKGLTSYPYSAAANQAQLLSDITATLNRVKPVFQAYHGFAVNDVAFAPYGDLFPSPISKSIVSDAFRGNFEITQTFTNDPRYSNDSTNSYAQQNAVSFVSSTQIDLNDEGVTEVTEQGTITGMGAKLVPNKPNHRYTAALNFYNNYAKAKSISNVQAGKNGPLTNTITKSSFTGSELDGIVQYSITATDLSDFTDGQLANTPFRKSSVEVTVSMPVAMTQTYNVVNAKQIIQPQNQATVGTVNMAIKMRGSRKVSRQGFSPYLTKAKIIAQGYLSGSSHINNILNNYLSYLKTASYTFAPNTNEFTLNLTWNFFPYQDVSFNNLQLTPQP